MICRRSEPGAGPMHGADPVDRPWPGFPWTFILAVYALSVPFWVLGHLLGAHLLLGLPLSALAVLCPAAVAGVYAWRVGGRPGVGRLLARSFDVHGTGSSLWWVLAALLMPLILLVASVVMWAASYPLPGASVPWSHLPALLLLFLIAAAGEELAWSATLLDPLQSRVGSGAAALIIGAVWVGWHLIPFAQAHPAPSWILGQCLFSLGFRVVLVWLYNNAGHRAFAAILSHATYNVAWQLFPNHGSAYNPWVAAALTGLVAVGITLGWARRSLTERASRTEGGPAR